MKIETAVNIGARTARGVLEDSAFWTFAAVTWHKLYEPYVPMRTGTLQRQVVIAPGEIEHTAPYARYIYGGEAYGPSYPIYQNGIIVGYASPKGKTKHALGRALRYRTELHPLATKEWDKAAEPTQKSKLIAALQAYVDRGGLRLGG